MPSLRFAASLERIRAQIEKLSADRRAQLEEKLEFEPLEAAAWQDLQARAYAVGILGLEEAQFLHRAIGMGGQWPARTDLATKVLVTQVIHELANGPIGWRRSG